MTAAGFLLVVFIITTLLKSLQPEGSVLGSPFALELFPYLRKSEKGEAHFHVPAHIVTTKTAPAEGKRHLEERAMSLQVAYKDFPLPNYNLHAFYYSWYGNPQFDGKYIHWNHPVLPHWDSKVDSRYPKERHSPPEDIGANFYPALGAYSSRDPSVVEAHMQQLRTAAVGESGSDSPFFNIAHFSARSLINILATLEISPSGLDLFVMFLRYLPWALERLSFESCYGLPFVIFCLYI